MSEKYLCFGGQTLVIRYPLQAAAVIDFTFLDFAEGCASDVTTIIIVTYDEKRKLFSVADSGKKIGSDLDKIDLALLLLTRSTYSLVHDIKGGMAIHGAAVQRGGNAVLMPGNSGIGKSTLVTWLLSRGYGYLTDELVYLPEGTDHFNALVRPLHIKKSGLPVIEDFTQHQNRRGLTLQNKSGALFSHRLFDNQLIQTTPQLSLLLFIEYTHNGALSLDVISPARAAQRLMGGLVNGRNLKLHGFSQIAALTRQIPALTLQYGNFDQLGKVVKPIIDFVLDTSCSRSSLHGFIRAFHRLTTKQPTAVASTKAPAPVFPIQKATPLKKRRKLTIGMATYDDYDGVYFSIQALRMYHPEVAGDSEILVIDNHPDGPCAESLKKLDESIKGYRYLPLQDKQGTAVRDYIFHHAAGDYVLCMDCHVFIVPGAIKKLINYFDANPGCKDLLQGPMIHDNLKKLSTHFEPIWRKGMYGIWGQDSRGDNKEDEPFAIPMQGLGLFTCRKDVWPGFNPRFRGFGGEEGYIHEKFRQAGGQTLCLPFLRWLHRFARPRGVPYPIQWEDRIRNYMIGFDELGLDIEPIRKHFSELLGKEVMKNMYEKIKKEDAAEDI